MFEPRRSGLHSGHGGSLSDVFEDTRPRVVLVDDDPLVLAITRRVLRRAGYVVSICEQAHAALREVEQRKPFALVADLYMPDMNGPELLGLSRECSPDTRRVLYTGEAQVAELERSLMPEVAHAIVAKDDGDVSLPSVLDELRSGE